MWGKSRGAGADLSISGTGCLWSVRIGGEGFLSGDKGFEEVGVKQGWSANFVDVHFDEDEVRIVTGRELALVLFGEFSVCRALGVGVESLAASDFVGGKILFGSGLILSRDCCVESAKGVDGFDGVVGAEGERDACVEEAFQA